MLAASTFDITIGGLTLILILVIAAVFLARHDRVTRVRFGIFLERERHRDAEEPLEPSEEETKILGPWPGEEKEEE
jgi:hypothetical protein